MMQPAQTTTLVTGVPITVADPQQAVELVIGRAAARAGGDVHLCNAYTLALADSDQGFRALLLDAAVNFADGMSVVWASRTGNGPRLPARVYGPDLFEAVLDQGRNADLHHYLYGATPDTVALLANRGVQPGAASVRWARIKRCR